MEIRVFYCYMFVSCIIFPSLLSKPISLNDIIAAEKKAASLQPAQTKISETKTNIENLRNIDNLSTKALTKQTTGSIIPITKKISPLKYKKTFQIKAPLRPKRRKYTYKPRNRRINTTAKREITDDEKFNRNYIPLLKSLSVLFNNILGSDSREDDEQYYQRYRSNSNQQPTRSEECPCAKSEYNRGPKPAKKTTASTTSITTKIPSKIKTDDSPETSASSTHYTFDDNIRPFRRNKNISLLSTRNTTSSWGNHNGFGTSSLSTHHRDLEGHIPRNNGNDESNNSGGRETDSYTENNKEYPNSSTGDDASCNGSCGTIGRNRNNTENTENDTTTTETDIIFHFTDQAPESTETFASDRGDSNQPEGYDKFETGRNETKSRTFLPKSHSRLRGYDTKKETAEISWQIQSPQENTFNFTNNVTISNQRISNGNGSMAEKDQEFRRTDKTIILDNINLTANLVNKQQTNLTNDKQKIVMIYDGYSIARDVNGANKLTEKAYRIHS